MRQNSIMGKCFEKYETVPGKVILLLYSLRCFGLPISVEIKQLNMKHQFHKGNIAEWTVVKRSI